MSEVNTISIEALESPKNAKDKGIVRIKRGDDLKIRLAIFKGENELANLTDVSKIKFEIYDIGQYQSVAPRSCIILAQKICENPNTSLTYENWADGTNQHALFSFNSVELSFDSGEKWVKISASLNNNEVCTLCSGWIEVDENYTCSTAYTPPDVEEFKHAAEISASAAESAKVAAISAKENAEIYKNAANNFKDFAETAKLQAEAARDICETNANNTASDKLLVETYKNETINLKNATETAKSEAEAVAQTLTESDLSKLSRKATLISNGDGGATIVNSENILNSLPFSLCFRAKFKESSTGAFLFRKYKNSGNLINIIRDFSSNDLRLYIGINGNDGTSAKGTCNAAIYAAGLLKYNTWYNFCIVCTDSLTNGYLNLKVYRDNTLTDINYTNPGPYYTQHTLTSTDISGNDAMVNISENCAVEFKDIKIFNFELPKTKVLDTNNIGYSVEQYNLGEETPQSLLTATSGNMCQLDMADIADSYQIKDLSKNSHDIVLKGSSIYTKEHNLACMRGKQVWASDVSTTAYLLGNYEIIPANCEVEFFAKSSAECTLTSTAFASAVSVSTSWTKATTFINGASAIKLPVAPSVGGITLEYCIRITKLNQ